MANKSETTLPTEYQERPEFLRVTLTLPPELVNFMDAQARRFLSVRGDGNRSAYVRELLEAHRDSFVGKRRGRK
jgi:hypothetical protein